MIQCRLHKTKKHTVSRLLPATSRGQAGTGTDHPTQHSSLSPASAFPVGMDLLRGNIAQREKIRKNKGVRLQARVDDCNDDGEVCTCGRCTSRQRHPCLLYSRCAKCVPSLLTDECLVFSVTGPGRRGPGILEALCEGDYGGGSRVGRPFGARWLAPLRGGAGPRCP